MAHQYVEIPYIAGMMCPPKANGWVLEHREVAARKIGRPLRPEEVVHHVDENKRNNAPANLWVFSTDADHQRFHGGGTLVDNGDGTYRCEGHSAVCACGKAIDPGASACMRCWGRDRRKVEWPTADDLRELVWSMPTRDVAKRFGVSDVAVSNWCKVLGVEKPPRGYWNKVAAACRLQG